MLDVACVFVFGLFFGEFVGYWIHRFLHLKVTGSLYRAHMAHHLKAYPPDDLLSKEYRTVGFESTTYRFVIAGVFLGLVFFLLTPMRFSVPMAVAMAFLGWLNSYIHDATHIDGHFLERFAIFKKLRALHKVHHKLDMSRNYGIVTFMNDKVFKTFEEQP